MDFHCLFLARFEKYLFKTLELFWRFENRALHICHINLRNLRPIPLAGIAHAEGER